MTPTPSFLDAGTRCDGRVEIGSDPHVWTAQCERERGHSGPHTSTYTWWARPSDEERER